MNNDRLDLDLIDHWIEREHRAGRQPEYEFDLFAMQDMATSPGLNREWAQDDARYREEMELGGRRLSDTPDVYGIAAKSDKV